MPDNHPTRSYKVRDLKLLWGLAVARGANHYRRDFDPALPADCPAIGVALSLGENSYDLDSLRVAAQCPSSPRTDWLCRHE